MIVRDRNFIVVQHNPDDRAYLDGGDSANRTGILALCGSTQDQRLLPLFVWSGNLVRHPSQPPWNNPKNFSRDQLIAFMAGCWQAQKFNISRVQFWRHLRRGFFCQNTERDAVGTGWKVPDILGPDHIWHLILCGRVRSMYWFAPIGWLGLIAAILWATKVTPKGEQNQTVAQAIVGGRFFAWLWLNLHPTPLGSLLSYWGDRHQEEIAKDLFSRVCDRVYGGR